MRVTGKARLYNFLYPHVNFFVKRFYRQFRMKGFEKIPKGEAVILAPNHQNAFMDAIVLLDGMGWKNQLSYLVRASIFKSKFVANLLHSINMLPVYRKDVDGAENMDKNDEIFDNCKFILEHRRPLVLFPEGTHNLKRRLIPLKKGISRIAFGVEEAHAFQLGVKIFPVGINYSNPRNFHEDLLIQVGDPILLSDYAELYRESPAKANFRIKAELEKRMRELMIDVRNDEYYELIEGLRNIDANEKGIDDVEKEFDNAKQLIEKCEEWIKSNPEKAAELKEKHVSYSFDLQQFQVSDKYLSASAPVFNPVTEILLGLFLSPLVTFGAIHSFIPFVVPRYVVKKYIKDPAFHSSIKVALAAFLFPIMHVLFCSIFWIISGSFTGALLYWFVMMITGEVALWYYLRAERIWTYRRAQRLLQSGKWTELSAIRSELVKVCRSF